MKRRSFIQKTALTSGAISIGGNLAFGKQPNTNLGHNFNLRYAPHLGHLYAIGVLLYCN
jgi:hydroxypyruvate isomerase